MVFHESYYDAIKLLPDDKRLEAYDAIMLYEFGGIEPEKLSYEVELIFTLLKPLLDAAQEKRANGKKGGRPRKEPEENGTKNHKFSERETIGFENQKASEVNGSEVKESEGKKKMRVPTRDEVVAYCLERNNHVDPDVFTDFYAAKGWKVGNAPMRDWKAAVRTWERRKMYPERDGPKIETHDYDMDALERALAL